MPGHREQYQEIAAADGEEEDTFTTYESLVKKYEKLQCFNCIVG